MSFWSTAFNPYAFNNDAYQVQRSTAIIAVGVQDEIEKEIRRERQAKKKELELKRKIKTLAPKEITSKINLDLKANDDSISQLNLLKAELDQALLKEEEQKKKLAKWEEEELMVLFMLLEEE